MTETARKTHFQALRFLIIIVTVFNGMLGFWKIQNSFSGTVIYKKDIVQEYLMAKAVLHGSNPYIPVNELAATWLSDGANVTHIKHPSLHPPTAVILSLPLGLLSYQQAMLAWLGFEVLCLLGALLLIIHGLDWHTRPLTPFLVLFMALGFSPVEEELWSGQLNACMLLLLTGSWLSLRSEKEYLGGVLLGGVIALKWMAWPFALFLILRRNWKCLAAMTMAIGAANLIALSVLGLEVLREYYFKIVSLGSYLSTNEANLAISALGMHLFAEIGWFHKFLPLWKAPVLAVLLNYSLTLTTLVIGIRAALKTKTFNTAFGILIGLSVLVSPIAWRHYLLLAAIPFAILLDKLRVQKFTAKQSIQLFTLCFPLIFSTGTYLLFIRITPGVKMPDGNFVVPFALGMLMMLPTTFLVGLLWWLWRLDNAVLPVEVTGS